MKKTEKLFRVSHEQTAYSHGAYHNCTIDLVNNGYGNSCNYTMARWQANSDKPFDYYAGKCDMKWERSESELKQVIAEAKLFLIDGYFAATPSIAIDHLESKGYRRAVYDGRESKFIAVDKLAPRNHVRWMSLDGDNCQSAILAPADDEAGAERALFKSMAAYSQASLEKWILAGKPKKIDSNAGYPNISMPQLDATKDEEAA